MSNSGKSFLAAALCRIFKQDGYKTAPFKSQNMALNSYITKDGLEIGRAQAMQAEAAGIEPSALMNPILLKPTSHMGSQVVVMGEVYGNLKAMDYYRRKREFIPIIKDAFAKLEEEYDVIVLEGAGSPAEINLRDNDIVNMGMAQMADAPVLLVGDIDRGGVFASLYGTVKLLEEEEQKRIGGLVINKFRGDVDILKPGLSMIEEKIGIPVVGVIPMEEIDIDDEDSLSDRLGNRSQKGENSIDIAVVHFPHISNFTDFNPLEQIEGVSVRYVKQQKELLKPDLVILPGTKNTMADLLWMRENGIEAGILKLAEEDTPVIGICGGYQMLGNVLKDPDGVEGKPGSELRGMGLLQAETVFASQKTRTRVAGIVQADKGIFASGSGRKIEGYEIHMGVTVPVKEEIGLKVQPAVLLEDGRLDGLCSLDGQVFGTYLHGLFDNLEWIGKILETAALKKGKILGQNRESWKEYKERQYDRLADLVRNSIDMDAVYRMMGLEVKKQWIRPEEIEARSMEIIQSEMPAGDWTPEELSVVKRCIHTSADFDYAKNLYFSENAVARCLEIFGSGRGFTIVTDTNMAASGINKSALKTLGGSVCCFMADPKVAEEAKARGVTRAMVSMEYAKRLEGHVIFAVGNAPTALIRLHEMIEAGEIHPDFIIAVPVGFVNVVESKELIVEGNVPCIVARGRKGGSNIAAAICNALMYQLTRTGKTPKK